MAFITTNDGVKIHYEEKGRGKPLILIPGWSCSTKFFVRNFDELAKSYRVVSMDLRGHGESEKPARGYRIARFAKDLKDLLDSLDIRDANLLGWSMGGSVIWSYIDLFGNDRLDKLILVDQTPRQYHNPEWEWGGGCRNAEELAIVTTRLEYDPVGVARGLVTACMAENPTPEEVDFFAGEILKCPPAVRAAIMADHTAQDWRDILPTISLPTLVMVGARSKVFPNQGVEYAARNIPGCMTVYFEKSGHMPFYEEPEKFNQVVKEFLG